MPVILGASFRLRRSRPPFTLGVWMGLYARLTPPARPPGWRRKGQKKIRKISPNWVDILTQLVYSDSVRWGTPDAETTSQGRRR